MKKYLKLLRIKHYLKNGLILLPFFCAKELFNIEMWKRVAPGFIAFCLVSSVIYIINDIKDRDKDRKHPTKKDRPIASGAISVKKAIVVAAGLLIVGAAFNFIAFSGWQSWLILGLYFLLNLGYSSGLKNIPIVDICILVSGFFIRVLYGSCVSGVVISNWMYLTVLMLSFYLGLGKRRNELAKHKDGETREVLKFYTHEFLDKYMHVCLGITIIFYSLWCVDPTTIANLGNNLIWTIPFVLAICMKYGLDIESNSDGDPVNVILKDKILLVSGALFAIVFGLLIYL